MSRVPLVDLKAQQAEIADEVATGMAEVLAGAGFIGGPQVASFEVEYAGFAGVEHVVGVANGTDALEMALRATGVTRRDEVIIPANTFIATAEAVSRIGAVPVLVDVDPEFLLIDPDAVEAAMTPRTRAIMPVHLFGQVAPVERLLDLSRRTGVAIVEDAAQSQGASHGGVPAGSSGAAAGTSFYPGKNLGAAGDAGAVLTNDPDVARTARALGAHGGLAKYRHDLVGFNSRMDALQAVVLRAKLRRLAAWNDARREAADRYAQLLGAVDGLELPRSRPGSIDAWHLYVVRVANQQGLIGALDAAGVDAGIHYPAPVHLTGAYQHLGHRAGAFPVSEAAAASIVSLPLYPHITAAQQERVAEAVIAALSGAGSLSAAG